MIPGEEEDGADTHHIKRHISESLENLDEYRQNINFHACELEQIREETSCCMHPLHVPSGRTNGFSPATMSVGTTLNSTRPIPMLIIHTLAQ